MPRKAFVADFEGLTRSGGCCNISDIKRGDDDGYFKFVFTEARAAAQGVEITAIVPELSEYPDSHQVFIYTESANVPTCISSALQHLDVNRMNLMTIVQTVCRKLSNAGQMDCSQDGAGDDYPETEIEMDDGDEDYGFGSENDSTGGWSDDDETSSDIYMSNKPQKPVNIIKRQTLQKALRDDLKPLKAAGYRVGVLGDHKGGMDLYVSVSIRVAKLGISEEALSAWKLDPSKYLILLLHYTSFYQTLDELTRDYSYHSSKSLEMCVGSHFNYKPTLAQAIAAFSNCKIPESSSKNNAGAFGSPIKGLFDSSKDNSFRAIFISGPLKELLNNRLIQLLKYRRQFGMGWDGAELFYDENQGRERSNFAEDPDERFYFSQKPRNALAQIVTNDALVSRYGQNVSFPLLAMQFTLRHLVRCTEFCLVCHNKVSTDFEALKPYVCSNPLCLYQYMALGFGPRIEHEILHQPTVVDLLINFCYCSAIGGRLRDFPQGMSLMVPNPTKANYTAQYHRHKYEINFEKYQKPLVKVGDWIQFNVDGYSKNDEWHAKVIESEYDGVIRISSPLNFRVELGANQWWTNTGPPLVKGKRPPTPKEEIVSITFQIYDFNFDGLEDAHKRLMILTLLSSVPKVQEMKSWLENNSKNGEEPSLRQWNDRLSPAALGVLRWIIASNRSCIVPLTGDSKKPGEQKVLGMDNYIQFRFAMGAPDKEQRFINSLREAGERLKLGYPSIFAFHGSPMCNWHSIIREGLHFKETAHGRAYGNGCYHSLDVNTSLGYSGTHYVEGWPQSDMKITSVLSLNEIVNAPNEFVSKIPHLVVQHLDWIQTRYLFVNTPQVSGAVTTEPTFVHPQDPSYTPNGYAGKKLIIPTTPAALARLPAHIDDLQPKNKKLKNVSTKEIRVLSKVPFLNKTPLLEEVIPSVDIWDTMSVRSDDSDLEALLSDSEGDSLNAQPKEIIGNLKRNRVDAFTPGSLDYTKIQVLPQPMYASRGATQRLNKDFRSLVKLQESQPLEDLGFYVNPEIQNMYQWIVELHSFPENLPLVKDMRAKNPMLRSIVLEFRFGAEYPMSPPFVRVIQPRFRSFMEGGGGHITAGGALCMELLTNSGWSAVSTLESVLLQIRIAICEEKPAARLSDGPIGTYSAYEAKEAFLRACRNHNWVIPPDFLRMEFH